MNAGEIWLVRHGETEWSKSGQHTGRTEIELTEVGRAQATNLRAVFATVRPSLVLCSPRVRAQQTAELAGLHVDAIDPDLAEWDYGAYEGMTSAQISAHDPGWTIWTGVVPDGETIAQVSARADRVLARARVALSAGDDGPVVLVAHGHISRVIGARWIDLPGARGGSLALGTAATCVLGVEHAAAVLTHWNVTHHSTQEA